MLMSDDDYYLQISEDENKIELPSDISRKKRKSREKKTKFFKKFKWPFIISLLIVAYLFYQPFVLFILNILKSNPTTYNYYLTVESNILNKTLLGLFFISILGSLFFLILPSEAIFLYYLNSTSYFFGFTILVTVIGSLVGLTFNYFFGFALGERVLMFLFKKNFFKYKEKIEKYGGLVLFFGNILPGPIEVLAVFYGSFKFDYKRFLFLAMMGRLIKYIILFIAFFFFWDQITFYYNSIMNLF